MVRLRFDRQEAILMFSSFLWFRVSLLLLSSSPNVGPNAQSVDTGDDECSPSAAREDFAGGGDRIFGRMWARLEFGRCVIVAHQGT